MPSSKTDQKSQTVLAGTLMPKQLALLARGRVDGWVTMDQVVIATPNAEENLDNLDELMTALEKAGIAVLESPPTDERKPPPRKKSPGPRMDEEALVVAADMDDGVGVYFKEVGYIPLLTREEEVMLAKRMEGGILAQKQLQGDENGDLAQVERQQNEQLVQDGQEAFDHLVTANSRLVISIAKKYIGREAAPEGR